LSWFKKSKNKKEKPEDEAAAEQPLADEADAPQPQQLEQALSDEADDPQPPDFEVEETDAESTTTTNPPPSPLTETESSPEAEPEKAGYFKRQTSGSRRRWRSLNGFQRLKLPRSVR